MRGGGDGDARLILEHQGVEAHLRGFPDIIEFFAQAFGEFLVDFLVLDGVVHAVIDGEGEAELTQIGFHHARHVGVLQLAGDIPCRR